MPGVSVSGPGARTGRWWVSGGCRWPLLGVAGARGPSWARLAPARRLAPPGRLAPAQALAPQALARRAAGRPIRRPRAAFGPPGEPRRQPNPVFAAQRTTQADRASAARDRWAARRPEGDAPARNGDAPPPANERPATTFRRRPSRHREPHQLLLRELQVRGRRVLLQLLDRAGTRDRDRVRDARSPTPAPPAPAWPPWAAATSAHGPQRRSTPAAAPARIALRSAEARVPGQSRAPGEQTLAQRRVRDHDPPGPAAYGTRSAAGAGPRARAAPGSRRPARGAPPRPPATGRA